MATSKHRVLPLPLLKQLKAAPPKQGTDWDDLCRSISEGNVIPIVANSVHGDRIFTSIAQRAATQHTSEPEEATDARPGTGSGQTIDEQLAEAWATSIGYPLSDAHSLARVARYHRLKSSSPNASNQTYLTFLKETLLAYADQFGITNPGHVRNLIQDIHKKSFSDIADDLELPDDLPVEKDPLRLLAQLPLPIYVTTSYYDFLERALEAQGRTPRTQVCTMAGGLDTEHSIDRDLVPRPETPVVYHLHGLEKYPLSLVLSEDDYLDFLVELWQPFEQNRPLIPPALIVKLANSALLLLGFRVQDWDFSTVFRGLITRRPASKRPQCIAIQLSPRDKYEENTSLEIERYLEDYFKEPAKFSVEWSDSTAFMHSLWERWNRWRG